MSDNKKLNVLITGAGRGIGRSVAEKLLARGYTVGVYDLSGDEKWAEDNANAIVGSLNVTDPEQWEEALKDFVAKAGSLDVLVNNAGILYGTPFEEGSFKQDGALVDVNIKGVLYGSRAALPYLKGSRGQVVNLCSASAIYGTPDMATYSATKFAVRGITEGPRGRVGRVRHRRQGSLAALRKDWHVGKCRHRRHQPYGYPSDR